MFLPHQPAGSDLRKRVERSAPAAGRGIRCRLNAFLAVVFAAALFLANPAVGWAQESSKHPGGEANLVLPDLGQATFLGGIDGRTLLEYGLIIVALGLLFGLVIFYQLKNMPVHKSMLEDLRAHYRDLQDLPNYPG